MPSHILHELRLLAGAMKDARAADTTVRRACAPWLLSLAVTFATACSSPAPSRPQPAPPPGVPAPPTASAPTPALPPAPRLVFQDPGDWIRADVEVAGLGRRFITETGDHVAVIDAATREVWLNERWQGGFGGLDIDPSWQRICAITADQSQSLVGVFDIPSRRWLWKTPVGNLQQRWHLAAGVGVCSISVLEGLALRPLRFDLLTGAPLAPAIDPIARDPFDEQRVLWSRDLRRRYALRRLILKDGLVPQLDVDLRDGATLGRIAAFRANCVELRADGEAIGLPPNASPGYAAGLARKAQASLIACAPPPHLNGRDAPVNGIPAVSDGSIYPGPWAPTPDGRLVYHGAEGLFVWDFARHLSPVRIGDPPVIRYRDANAAMRPLEPVISFESDWVGVVDDAGVLLRWDARTAAPLAAVRLPAAPPGQAAAQAHWQVFSGAGGRLAAAREVDNGRVLFVGGVDARSWQRSGAKLFGDIWQYVEWVPDDGGQWLLSDPHYGISRVDPSSGRVSASFAPPPTFSRISRAERSPDGAQLFVAVGPWAKDGWVGSYILDARTLRVIRKMPPVGRSNAPAHSHGQIEWRADGIFFGEAGAAFSQPKWMRLDPLTGVAALIGFGDVREYMAYRHAGGLHVARSDHGFAIVGARLEADDAIAGILAGGAFVQTSDGKLWCEGKGCDRFRCFVDGKTLANVDHPACAPMRVRASP